LYDKLKNDVTDPSKIYQWRRQYVRENKKNVCPTLTANMGTGGHNVPIIKDSHGIRKLTPRECLRLQGFPDSYVLPSISDGTLYKQVGNSVSVPVIKRIAQQIRMTLD
jgi:DNA (cytosine-5)-methyltransferase 1